jgi:pilus assembly protein Flp/PilA
MFPSRLAVWFSDDEGATAAEYAVMLALIIAAVITSINAVGNSVASGWSNNVTKIDNALTGS